MSVAEEAIRNATGSANAPLEYSNYPNRINLDMADWMKSSIQEYAQRNYSMRVSRGSQGTQYGRGQTSSTTTSSMFAERIYQLFQSWNKEGFISVNQDFIICEMVDPSTSRSAQLMCAASIITLNDREPQ